MKCMQNNAYYKECIWTTQMPYSVLQEMHLLREGVDSVVKSSVKISDETATKKR